MKSRVETVNISRNEYSVACTLYNNSIREQDNDPITIEDIKIVKEGNQGSVDFLDEKVRIRNIR